MNATIQVDSDIPKQLYPIEGYIILVLAKAQTPLDVAYHATKAFCTPVPVALHAHLNELVPNLHYFTMRTGQISLQACMLALTWLSLQAQRGTGQRTAHGLTRATAQITEETYWQSRRAAELAWHAHVPKANMGTFLSIPGNPFVRIWDLYAADYSCPYIRVRATHL